MFWHKLIVLMGRKFDLDIIGLEEGAVYGLFFNQFDPEIEEANMTLVPYCKTTSIELTLTGTNIDSETFIIGPFSVISSIFCFLI